MLVAPPAELPVKIPWRTRRRPTGSVIQRSDGQRRGRDGEERERRSSRERRVEIAAGRGCDEEGGGDVGRWQVSWRAGELECRSAGVQEGGCGSGSGWCKGGRLEARRGDGC